MMLVIFGVVVTDEPTVRDYFEDAFPDHVYREDRDPLDLGSIRINSSCGDDCKRAIDHGVNMVESIRMAHGRQEKAFAFEAQVSEMVADICGVFICG